MNVSNSLIKPIKTIGVFLLCILSLSCEKDEVTKQTKQINNTSNFPFNFSVKASIGQAYDISCYSAIVPLTIRNLGDNKAVSFSLCYSDTTLNPTIENQLLDLGTFRFVNDSIVLDTKIEKLKHHTTYQVRAYCKPSDSDTAYSVPISFYSPRDERLPFITTQDAQMASLNSATLRGTIVNTGKSEAVTEHGFVIAKTKNPTINHRKVDLGNSGSKSFRCDIKDLGENTLYYFRAYAINEYGIEYGEEMKFYTSCSFKTNIGGYEDEKANSVFQTIDGGFILAGKSSSNVKGSILPHNGSDDYYIVKLYANGKVQWHTYLGGSGNDEAYSITGTSDGGYIIAGQSQGGIDRINAGLKEKHDAYIVKLDTQGQIEWEKLFGGSTGDYAYSIKEITTGGYIVAGQTTSNDGDIKQHKGGQDYWVFKLSETGNLIWSKAFGGTGVDIGEDVVEDADGGFLAVGASTSEDKDITSPNGSWDAWVLKLDASGNIMWDKSIGNSNWNGATGIRKTKDGGSIIAGYYSHYYGTLINDFLAVKLDPSGNIEWKKTFGGENNDYAYDVAETKDGNYIMTGWIRSNDGDVSQNKGDYDAWIVKYNSSGILWQKTFGGTGSDILNSIQQTWDEGYIATGYSNSTDGDITQGIGGDDCWVVRFYEKDVK